MKSGYLMLLYCATLSGCDVSNDLAFFKESAWQPALRCVTRPAPMEGADISDLIPVGDSAFAAVFPGEREVITYNRAMQPTHRLRMETYGPRGVRNAVSAAVSDTLLFVADDAGNVIRKFDRDGRERGVIQLSFVPRRLRLSGGQLLVTPLVAGAVPSHLLFAVNGDKAETLGAPIAPYQDIGVNTLANMASLAVFPRRVVLLHEMVVPFGYVFDGSRRNQFNRFAVPLADDVRERVRRLPKEPITEKNVNELTVVAFAAAASLDDGHTYYVTRIGDGHRQSYRKLLVELDSKMQLHAVYPMNVHPHHMVFLSHPRAIVVVDAASNWFECRVP
ncbi:MAG TPA: hypothetical protein VGD49_01370 [Longimicrobiales bacterium]